MQQSTRDLFDRASATAARLGDVLPTLYVSSDGRTLTTWSGNRVAPLCAGGKVRAFGTQLTCYSAVIEGRNYYGRSQGPNMFINLRAGRKVSP